MKSYCCTWYLVPDNTYLMVDRRFGFALSLGSQSRAGPRDSRRGLQQWRGEAAVDRSKPNKRNILEHPLTRYSAGQRSSNHASHDIHVAGDASNEHPRSLFLFGLLFDKRGLLRRYDSQPQATQHEIFAIGHNIWLCARPAPPPRSGVSSICPLSFFRSNRKRNSESKSWTKS